MTHRQRKPVGRWMPVTATLFLVMLTEPAWAYLDPGTGSMIISAIVGLFATVGLAIKTYWYKIKAFFRKSEAESPAGSDATLDSRSDPESSADH